MTELERDRYRKVIADFAAECSTLASELAATNKALLAMRTEYNRLVVRLKAEEEPVARSDSGRLESA